MRRRNTELLSSVIDQVLKNSNIERTLNEKRLIAAWPKVLGASITQYTSKLEIKRKVLYVTLTSSVLRHDLYLSGDQIKESLNKCVGAEIINSIVFC